MIAWRGKVFAKSSHGRVSSVKMIGGAVTSTPGMSPISVVGRPRKRIRSEAIGSGTPEVRTSQSRRPFSQISLRGSEVFLESGSHDRLVSGSAGRSNRSEVVVKSAIFHFSSSRIECLNVSKSAAQGHLVIDEQRHQLFMVAPRAAIELGNEIASTAGEPVGPRHLQPSHPGDLETA